MKLLTPQLADSEQFRQRFIRESRLAASLDHPNIVPIYEAGEADGQLFIAMRYVIGSDLKGLLAEQGGQLPLALDAAAVRPDRGRAGLRPPGRAGAPGRQAGEHPRRFRGAPAAAHGDHVYLTDFGLTKRTSELSGGLTGTGHFLGTVDYVSPSRSRASRSGRHGHLRAGLRALRVPDRAAALPPGRRRRAAVGAPGRDAARRSPVIRPELPGAVDAVVARAMAKDPADRYESCEELLRRARAGPRRTCGGAHS